MDLKEVTHQVIGAAIEVHRLLGPGLLESAYKQSHCHELRLRGIRFDVERPLPVRYKGVQLDCGYKLDLVVEDAVVLELKAVEKLLPIHEAQFLTYLKLGGWSVGLLMNFNAVKLTDGLKRIVCNYQD